MTSTLLFIFSDCTLSSVGVMFVLVPFAATGQCHLAVSMFRVMDGLIFELFEDFLIV